MLDTGNQCYYKLNSTSQSDHFLFLCPNKSSDNLSRTDLLDITPSCKQCKLCMVNLETDLRYVCAHSTKHKLNETLITEKSWRNPRKWRVFDSMKLLILSYISRNCLKSSEKLPGNSLNQVLEVYHLNDTILRNLSQ